MSTEKPRLGHGSGKATLRHVWVALHEENHLVEAEPRSREIHAVSYSGIFLKNL